MPDPHRAVHLIASILEVAGTFLLAVEAITLQKLEKLREGVFNRVLRFFTPHQRLEGTESPEQIKKIEKRLFNRAYWILTVVGWAALWLLIHMAGSSVTGVWQSLQTIVPGPQPLRISAAAFYTACLLTASVFLGYAVYWAALLPFRLSFNTLKLIEDNTASGAIGILGFLTFLAGAAIHAYLAWIHP